MKSGTRMNLVIIAFINWSIALCINETYNYISAMILVASLIYLLLNVKSVPGVEWKPVDFGQLFKSNKSDDMINSGCDCKNCTGQIEYYRFGLGIKKYGYDSEFRKEYESLIAQLRHHELNEFFDKWDVLKN